jgi:hypothetical protein
VATVLSFSATLQADSRSAAEFAYDTVIASIAALQEKNLSAAAFTAAANAPFLALTGLERRADAAAIDVIVRTNALRLDAALSEEQNCVVLRLGEKARGSLKRLKQNPAAGVADCEKRVLTLGIAAGLVCSTPEKTAKRTALQLAAIDRHEVCRQ